MRFWSPGDKARICEGVDESLWTILSTAPQFCLQHVSGIDAAKAIQSKTSVAQFSPQTTAFVASCQGRAGTTTRPCLEVVTPALGQYR
mmetsp:Transcript_61100/g.115426  ORF Transcript_61100/g.115426 Transcript_61100/m.115426 type:complete len:88 (+) Transcript_61100:555-818(+)